MCIEFLKQFKKLCQLYGLCIPFTTPAGEWNTILDTYQISSSHLSGLLTLQLPYFSFSGTIFKCRSQWPRGLRRRSSAARLLKLWVRIPPGAWMVVCCECCVLSGRGLCDGLITRPEECYRLWRVVVCDLETSKTRRLKPATGLWKYNHNGL